MDKEDEIKFKEYIFQAHQAGKSETSQLFQEIKDEVKSIVDTATENHKQTHDSLMELKNETINNTDALIAHDETLKSHNGRLSKVEKTILIVGAVSSTILIMNGSKAVELLGTIF